MSPVDLVLRLLFSLRLFFPFFLLEQLMNCFVQLFCLLRLFALQLILSLRACYSSPSSLLQLLEPVKQDILLAAPITSIGQFQPATASRPRVSRHTVIPAGALTTPRAIAAAATANYCSLTSAVTSSPHAQ